MPLTYTGRVIKPDGHEHPGLIDIAVSLSRQPRFAGHCHRWWSVLDHTLFGDELIKAKAGTPALRLAWLLHDAHESITGDIPTDFKNVQLRYSQGMLDEAIYAAFFGPCFYYSLEEDVKAIDARCLLAEALTVGPPAAGDHAEAFGFVPGETLWWEDKDALNRCLNKGTWAGIPPVTYPLLPTEHPGVVEYLARVVELL